MNILLIVLGIITGLIVLLLIIGLFSPKSYSLEREITINRPGPQVFDYIKYLKNQQYYLKYNMLDPNSKKEYTGVDGQPGFIYAWDSTHKSVGKGEQEIKRILEGEKVEYEIRFIKPFEGIMQSTMITDHLTPQQTRVRWKAGSKMKYPMNLSLLFMNMDKLIGKDFNESLANLKRNLEQ